jgi:hypothetical protein
MLESRLLFRKSSSIPPDYFHDKSGSKKRFPQEKDCADERKLEDGIAGVKHKLNHSKKSGGQHYGRVWKETSNSREDVDVWTHV